LLLFFPDGDHRIVVNPAAGIEDNNPERSAGESKRRFRSNGAMFGRGAGEPDADHVSVVGPGRAMGRR
jgi:hypothetical protein